ncbi:MAG: HD domain-containing protein [Inquilinus sp.]|nr:HD domain-containing protein [Inquilinus sp.]
MTRDGLGTWRWLERTGGRLGWRDRLALVGQGVRARASARLGGRAGRAVRHVDVDSVLPPDRALCRAAEALSAEASEDYLFNHCLRAYLWARLLNDGKPFDDEAVYVALLLHDLGLTERYRADAEEVQCFTLPAARVANRLALDHGWADRRAALVADAIALHLNVTVGDEYGREAQLVRLGSGADVAGLGLGRIDRDRRDAVVARHPRLGLKTRINAALVDDVARHPQGRLAFVCRHFGFRRLIRQAPFAD